MKDNNEVIEGEVVGEVELTLEQTLEQITHPKKIVYLQALLQCGYNDKSCQVVGIDRTLPWRWRETDEVFATAFHLVKKRYELGVLDELECELKARALDKTAPQSTLALFMALKSLDRAKYDDNQAHVRVTGDIIFKCEIPHAYDRKQLPEGKD